jgi:hypothetical protein
MRPIVWVVIAAAPAFVSLRGDRNEPVRGDDGARVMRAA